MKHKTKKQKNIKRITQSIPFYTISIFFAHFIHMHLMQNPNIFHAIFALLVSFSISFCFIYCLEYSIDWIHNFQDKLLEESKAAKNTIEDQQKIIEDQRKQLRNIDNLVEEKVNRLLNRSSLPSEGFRVGKQINTDCEWERSSGKDDDTSYYVQCKTHPNSFNCKYMEPLK